MVNHRQWACALPWQAAALTALALSAHSAMAQATASSDRMARVAQSMADRGLFSGAVLVARGDEVLLNRAYGKANLVWGIDNQPGHRFLLASVSKQFTAAAVLRLVDQGRLKLTDTLQQHLPDLPEAWRAITVQQLLTHTSGISNYTEAVNFGVIKTQRATPLELLAPVRALPLDFVPGSKMHYSNSGYLLLGLLIETLSGQSYADFMQAQVFKPLGMADSGTARSDMTIERLVSGHVREGHTLRPANFTDLSVPYAAGALYGTTGDLLKWQRGLYGGLVISPASLKAMTTPAHEDYALGLVVAHRGDQAYYWHSGGIDGFSTVLQYEPQQQLSLVALANEQHAAPQLLVRRLSILARGGQVVLPEERKPVSLPPETLARFVGAYQTPSEDITWVALRGQHLWAKASQHPWEPLQPQSATVLWAPSLDIELRFAPDPDPQGPMASLTAPDLTDEQPWQRTARALPSVAAQPVYLRGSMNQWSTQHALRAGDDGLHRLQLALPAGTHEFKIASQDWSTIDLGGPGGTASLPSQGRLAMVGTGSNLRLRLPKAAQCSFVLDGRDIIEPQLQWDCR